MYMYRMLCISLPLSLSLSLYIYVYIYVSILYTYMFAFRGNRQAAQQRRPLPRRAAGWAIYIHSHDNDARCGMYLSLGLIMSGMI